MLVRIRMEPGDGGDAPSPAPLFRWFLKDPDLAACCELTLVPRQDPNAQGGAFDVINAVIADGVGLGGLVLSYATWRQAHHSSAKIAFSRGDVTIQVSDASPETMRRLEDLLVDTLVDDAVLPDPELPDPELPERADKPDRLDEPNGLNEPDVAS